MEGAAYICRVCMLCICAGQQQGATLKDAHCALVVQVQNTSSQPFKAPDILSSELLRGKCKQSAFQTHPVTQPSICVFLQTLFSCLIYFILKGLSTCIAGTGRGKVSDVCQVGFLLLFVIVTNNGLPLSGHPPSSPTRPF